MALFKKDSNPSSHNPEITARFIEFIMMLAQETLFFLGKIPHPSTGKGEVNLEVAKLRIDQLEIIEIKTRGNRTDEEEDALKQALQAVRMAFVEVAGVGARNSLNDSDSQPQPAPKEDGASKPAPMPIQDDQPVAAAETKIPEPASASSSEDEEPKKRFSKSYGNL